MSKPSKRDSNSKKTGEQLPRNLPYFYLDETNDSDALAEALRAQNIKVQRHRDHFPKGTQDEVWLPIIAAKGWVILTRDSQWRYDEVEKAAFRSQTARALIISEGKNKMSDEAIAETILKAKTRISNLVKTTHPPFTAKLYRGGRVVKNQI